jgi:signal transduction histidine kinase/CheY-like chemotaxis protein
MRPAPSTLALLAALTALYFVAGKLGLTFATVHSSASAVWPPTGIALGAFLLFGNRAGPAIFVGAFLVNVTTAGSVFTSLGIAAGNTLEGMAGAYLVQRYASGTACFDRARDVFRFAALAAVIATAISATLGVATLSALGFAQWQDFGSIWLTWWLGDAVGALIVTPLMLLSRPSAGAALPRERVPEAVLALGTVATVAAVCFALPGVRQYPLTFLCLPPLVWIAFRLGTREVAMAIVLLTAVAVAATETGMGPFVMGSRNESLLVLQAFMGMVALTLLPMAALMREHRQAVAEAEAATRARDVFLALLSHELRNPLQGITTSLHLLSLPGVTRESADRAVAIARRQSEHLAKLMSDLLDVTRAVSGKMTIEMNPVRLDEAVRRYAELLLGLGRLEGRKLAVDAHAVTINADVVRLEQIVGNLISNAVKFTSAGGSIRIAVLDEGGKATLRVQDDGIGIGPELLPRVFDLFTQGERRHERSHGGLGVGLTLVRKLAEMHGGSVQAISAGAGEGSEFVVRFPLVEEPDGPAARRGAALEPPPEKAALSVLVIEDNADAREALVAVLASEGHAAYQAGNGEEGVEVAERARPDIVLVDIGLPGVDGYEVARRLRAREADLGATWRLIALTGYGQPEDVRRARDAGFDAHLVKPVLPQALEAVMATQQVPLDKISTSHDARQIAGSPLK